MFRGLLVSKLALPALVTLVLAAMPSHAFRANIGYWKGIASTALSLLTHDWTVQLGGPGVSEPQVNGYGVARDSSGNVYVTGYATSGINGQTKQGYSDLVIIKYDASGVHQFTIQVGSAGGHTEGKDLFVDSSGNINVTGVTSVGINGQTQNGEQDTFIAKYDSSGNHLWTKQIGNAGGEVRAKGITGDGSGNVYIFADTNVEVNAQTPTGNADLVIAKYHSSGTHQWTRLVGVADEYVHARAIAIDSTNNVYVTGSTPVGLNGQSMVGSVDLFIIKYNTSGTLQWTRHVGSGMSGAWGEGIAVDSANNVIVAGHANAGVNGQSKIGNLDVLITKYDSSGTHQWTRQFGVSGESAKGYDVGVDSSNSVYVTGETLAGLNSQTQNGNNDAFITKYNSSGTHQWTRQIGASGASSYGYSIAVDTSSNVLVTGATTAAINGQTQTGHEDLFVTKYNTSGTHQWTRQIGVVYGGSTSGSAVALDSSGNVYACGATNVGINSQPLSGAADLAIIKYNSSGAHQWTKIVGGSGGYTSASGIAVDSSNNLYVTGESSAAINGQSHLGGTDILIMKYNNAGTHQWTRQIGGPSYNYARDIAVDSSGNVLVTGYTWDGVNGQTQGGFQDLFVTKYDSAGTQLWTRQVGGSGGSGESFGHGIAVDSSNNVYVTGYTNIGVNGQAQNGDSDIIILKYDSSGTHQWTRQIGTSGGEAYGNGIAVDSSNNVYVTGVTRIGLNSQTMIGVEDLVLLKYNSSGTHQWTKLVGAAGSYTYGKAIAVASSHLYITGAALGGVNGQTQSGTDDILVTKYDTSGAHQATVQVGASGGLSSGDGIAVDASGNIHITGYSNRGINGQTAVGLDSDLILMKYH